MLPFSAKPDLAVNKSHRLCSAPRDLAKKRLPTSDHYKPS